MTLRLQFRCYTLPFRTAVRTAHGLWPVREGVIVRLEDEQGRKAYGEAAPIPGFSTETVADDTAGLRALGGQIEASRLSTIPTQLNCLRHALTTACSGLSDKSEEVSFVSASSSAVPSQATAPAAYLPVAALLPAGRAALEAISTKGDAGFRTFKWKVGVGEIADELALLEDLCAALPAGAKLRLDANGAWDRRRAERWLARCVECPIEFVEQPIAPTTRGADDLLLGLSADYPTPLALDESLAGEGDIERWLSLGWRGIFVMKPSLIGDVDGVLTHLAAAQAAVVFSSALETAVGAQAALRVAFRWPGAVRALGFGVWPLFAEARFDGPAATTFIRKEEVGRMNPEAIWNALS